MTSSVDAKLLKQTKFPPEFNRKVDMKKVNIEVMKKWIAGKISEILGNEDDVVIELCFNLLEGSRFPDIKSLQIQLTGFLDKDTPKFCKDLWSLCLSAQENPQGVPKELLEAKKLELIQEKIAAEKAAEEARRKREQELARERELEEIRRRERFDRNRGRRGGDRGGRDFDRRPYRDNRSPPRRLSRERFRDPPSRREFDSYVPSGSRRGRRPSRSPSASPSRSRSVSSSRSPPRRRLPSRDRYKRRRSTTVIELDPFPAVIHRAHVLPEETKGDEDLSLPAVHPVRLLPETGAEGKAAPTPGQGLGLDGRMRRIADGGDPHLTPQELTRMNQPLILQRPASPVMIAV
ncbi:hypothetical protein KXV25_009285 [Aspergillus fumigatus]|nr:hypothetical protein KXV25_009285 [Aspergillus fumigatus]